MESLGQLVGGTWLGCVPIAGTRGSSALIGDLGEVFGFGPKNSPESCRVGIARLLGWEF